jgi:hypothetical protein
MSGTTSRCSVTAVYYVFNVTQRLTSRAINLLSYSYSSPSQSSPHNDDSLNLFTLHYDPRAYTLERFVKPI